MREKAEPRAGQVWEHESGSRRRIVRMAELRSESWPDLEWERVDSKPGPGGGACSIKTWERWAKSARLI